MKSPFVKRKLPRTTCNKPEQTGMHLNNQALPRATQKQFKKGKQIIAFSLWVTNVFHGHSMLWVACTVKPVYSGDVLKRTPG